MQTLSLYLSAVCMLGLAGFVVWRGRRQALDLTFALFVVSAATWALGVAWAADPGNPLALMILGGHLAFMGGVLSLAGFVAFAIVFPARTIPPGRRRAVVGVIGLGVGMAALAATPAVFTEPDPATVLAGVPRPTYGPLFPVYLAASVALMVAIVVVLVQKYRGAATRRERSHVRYLLVAGSVASAVGVVGSLVLPQLGITTLGPVAPLVLVLFFAAAALAITKYRLFQLGIVFRQALITTGVFVVLTSVILASLSLWRTVVGDRPAVTMVALVATATMAGLTLPSIRRLMENAVDRYVFGGPPVDARALRQLSRDLTTMLSVDPLAELLVANIGRALRLRHVALYLQDTDAHGERWHAQAAYPFDHPAPPEIPADNPLLALARARMGPVVLDAAVPPSVDAATALQTQQHMLDADVVVPLAAEGRMLGLLVCSEKFNGDLLSDGELGVLATLGHQASTAFANAMLHEEILRMKVHNDNVLRAMVSGVIAVDQRGVITTCNRRAAELLNCTPGQCHLLGNSEDLLPDALGVPLREARVFGREATSIRASLPRPDGGAYEIAMGFTVLRDADGHTIGALVVFEDQTERLHLEAGMQRADRLASLGTLAAGLAHEIKNPLVSIRTLAQLLPQRFDDPEFRDTFAQLAAGEVERINDLLEHLLLFARPSPPHLQWLHLDMVIADVLHLLGPETDAQQVSVDTGPPQPDVWIYADAAQLRQVLLNLFMNALQAMEGTPQRRLTVRLDTEDGTDGTLQPPEHWSKAVGDAADHPSGRLGCAVLRVSDTGPGIPPDLRDEVFDPFFTTKPKGSGLGLAVVARIVREHGGRIASEPTAAGGACFVVHFPAYVPDPTPAPLS